MHYHSITEKGSQNGLHREVVFYCVLYLQHPLSEVLDSQELSDNASAREYKPLLLFLFLCPCR